MTITQEVVNLLPFSIAHITFHHKREDKEQRHCIMRLIYLFLLFISFLVNHAKACAPNEIHIREQWINAYTKKDGTKVSSHIRSEHCREVKGHRYFQDSNNDEIKGLKTSFKAWSENEKRLIE
jgi:hypothetical protein